MTSCPPALWTIPTRRYFDACASCAAANAFGSTSSTGGPATRCQSAAGTRSWNPVPWQSASARRARSFVALLADSVRLHLRSDVPVGTCLSGGLDSSSIVCLMARELAESAATQPRLNCVSACYDAKSIDERPFMEAVVQRTQSTPHWCHPRFEDAFALAERITWHQDEPYGSTSIFAQWCVFADAPAQRPQSHARRTRRRRAARRLSWLLPVLFRRSLSDSAQFVTLLYAMSQRRAWHGCFVCRTSAHVSVAAAAGGLARWLRRERQALVQHNWLDGERCARISAAARSQTARESIGRPPIADLGDLCVVLTQSSNLAMLLHWEDRN